MPALARHGKISTELNAGVEAVGLVARGSTAAMTRSTLPCTVHIANSIIFEQYIFLCLYVLYVCMGFGQNRGKDSLNYSVSNIVRALVAFGDDV